MKSIVKNKNALILDATAGNRAMWKKNKSPPNVVFMDREVGLYINPDVFCVWQYLPFRNKVFTCVLFDPPHDKFSQSSVHMNPKGWHEPRIKNGRKIGGTFWGSLEKGWYGVFFKAQKEFARVSSRLCLKWNNTKHSLEYVLRVFEDWREIYRTEYRTRKRRGKTRTWWVTFLANNSSI